MRWLWPLSSETQQAVGVRQEGAVQQVSYLAPDSEILRVPAPTWPRCIEQPWRPQQAAIQELKDGDVLLLLVIESHFEELQERRDACKPQQWDHELVQHLVLPSLDNHV